MTTGTKSDANANAIVAADGMHDLMARLLLRGGRCSPQAYDDVFHRELVCTPFEGAYGSAGWVLCVNGSPPRGTLVIMDDPSYTVPALVFYIDRDKARRLKGEEQARTIRAFYDSWLRGKREALTLVARRPAEVGGR